MARGSRVESAGFWVAVGTALATFGGIFVAVGVVQETAGNPAQVRLWSNGWFIFGIALAIAGALCLSLALGIRLTHWAEERSGNRTAPTASRWGPSPLLFPAVGKRPTDKEIKEWRAAKEKRDRGAKLSRREKKTLANPDMGITREGVVEWLGRQLTFGEFYLPDLTHAGRRFETEITRLQSTGTDEETFRAEWDKLYDDEETAKAKEWEKDLKEEVVKQLGYAYGARFESDAGLVPATPPEGIGDVHTKRWRHHEMRLQRLHELIRELSAKWDL